MSDSRTSDGDHVSFGDHGSAPYARRIRRFVVFLYRLGRMYARARIARDVTPLRLAQWSGKYSGKMVESTGIRIVCKGEPPASGRPLLLVSNHVSWIDPYVVNAVSGARFVAKAEISGWPFVGTIANGFGSFFHDRGNFRDARRTVSNLAAALIDGYRVGVFPEATTTSGAELLPFYPAMFESAVESGVAVQPVAIRYLDADGRLSAAPAYVDEATLLGTLRAIFARPFITAELEFGPIFESRGLSRGELAKRTNESVAGMLSVAPAPIRYGFSAEEERWTWLRHAD